MILKNKDKIIANWDKDMINGEGKYIYNHNKDEVKCMWYNDIRVEESNEWMYDRTVINLILIIGLIIIIYYRVTTNNPRLNILLIFWIIIYLIESFTSKTFYYLD